MRILNGVRSLLSGLSVRPDRVSKEGWDSFGLGSMLSLMLGSSTMETPVDKPGSITMFDLRWFSENFSPGAICIARRIDQLQSLDWKIVPISGVTDASADKQIKQAENWFTYFGGFGDEEQSPDDLISIIVRDLLSLGVMVLHKDVENGRVRVKDPLFIKPRVKEGKIADFEEKDGNGKVVGRYPRDRIVWRGLYGKSYSPYPIGPMEFVISEIAQWLAANSWNMAWFTDGDIPSGYWEVPPDLTVEKVMLFKEIWGVDPNNSIADRQKAKPVPPGTKFTPYMNRQDAQFLELISRCERITTAAFGMSPADLHQAETYKVSQEVQLEAGQRFGLRPITRVIGATITECIRDVIGLDKVQYKYSDEVEADATEETNRALDRMKSGTLTINEVRDRCGDPPIADPRCNRLFIITQTGPYWITGVPENEPNQQPINQDPSTNGQTEGQPGESGEQPGEQPGGAEGQTEQDTENQQVRTISKEVALAMKDLGGYKRKVKAKGAMCKFESENIPVTVLVGLKQRLAVAKEQGDVNDAFDWAHDEVHNIARVQTLAGSLSIVLAGLDEELARRKT